MLPFVESVLHPTDFSEASERAFAHALAIALFRRAKLTLLHVAETSSEEEWQRFPSVRGTLERWGVLEPGSERADVFRKLALKVKKVQIEDDDPADAVQAYLEEHPNDLLVLAMEHRGGLPAWLTGSGATKVARVAGVRTLFVPQGCHGFVSPTDGRLSLSRILVPVDHKPEPAPALELAARAANDLGTPPVAIRALHVGERMPELKLEPGNGFEVTSELRAGDPVAAILDAAGSWPADLVVMATDGRDGPLDIFRGSHTERVVRGIPCPLAAIPVPRAS
jgi:nucleotide-binding universal stress UspA family protein